jgi:hypothetical protein
MNTRRIMEKARMLDNLFGWETLAASCLTILGIIVTAAIYEWIGNPKILWLVVACLIGLEIYFTHTIIAFLEHRNLKTSAATTSPFITATSETTEPAVSRDNPGRIFEVLQGGLGTWPTAFKFTEYEFRKAYPRPTIPGVASALSLDDHYAEVLDGLLKSSHIREVSPNLSAQEA